MELNPSHILMTAGQRLSESLCNESLADARGPLKDKVLLSFQLSN
jgi:hypothetical protein